MKFNSNYATLLNKNIYGTGFNLQVPVFEKKFYAFFDIKKEVYLNLGANIGFGKDKIFFFITLKFPQVSHTSE